MGGRRNGARLVFEVGEGGEEWLMRARLPVWASGEERAGAGCTLVPFAYIQMRLLQGSWFFDFLLIL